VIEGKLVLKGWVGLPENRIAFLVRDQISRGNGLAWALGGGKSELSKKWCQDRSLESKPANERKEPVNAWRELRTSL